ncbi:hypothetical protein K437DRAFT_90074 [Tilletiaria anomala UBC 951]|uniref:Uncharacterized protein n=1 Tax=Tilletiaria anomala (strain ATCC 24038 / CBS 436.72 / UBC 951) TaxID=1037660 RepID=A0A066WA59_TILAU|nr:uncharacterized protein K437DRAFT_90074 [Tilletiaria anomala UBC 951]KDN47954.1 hypothetical protein K437DRAFT_90074 [Tilletiaria anomala UBC 951]
MQFARLIRTFSLMSFVLALSAAAVAVEQGQVPVAGVNDDVIPTETTISGFISRSERSFIPGEVSLDKVLVSPNQHRIHINAAKRDDSLLEFFQDPARSHSSKYSNKPAQRKTQEPSNRSEKRCNGEKCDAESKRHCASGKCHDESKHHCKSGKCHEEPKHPCKTGKCDEAQKKGAANPRTSSSTRPTKRCDDGKCGDKTKRHCKSGRCDPTAETYQRPVSSQPPKASSVSGKAPSIPTVPSPQEALANLGKRLTINPNQGLSLSIGDSSLTPAQKRFINSLPGAAELTSAEQVISKRRLFDDLPGVNPSGGSSAADANAPSQSADATTSPAPSATTSSTKPANASPQAQKKKHTAHKKAQQPKMQKKPVVTKQAN